MAERKKEPEVISEKTKAAEHKFSKEQLLASERFREKRDVTEALLEDGKGYSVNEAEETIRIYMRRKVR